MKYRLDTTVSVNDKILPEGTIVGDDCEETWRYSEQDHNANLRGQPRPPNSSMTPLDDEAKKLWKEAFPEEPLKGDPTQRIPITTDHRDTAGNHVPAPPGKPNPAPKPPNDPNFGAFGNPAKDDSVAKEDPLGNKTPQQHKPGEDKPLPPAKPK